MTYVIRLAFNADAKSCVSYDVSLAQAYIKKDDIALNYIIDADTAEQANKMGRALTRLCCNVHSLHSGLIHFQDKNDQMRDLADIVKLLLQAFGYTADIEANLQCVRELADIFDKNNIERTYDACRDSDKNPLAQLNTVALSEIPIDGALIETAKAVSRALLVDERERTTRELSEAIDAKIKSIYQAFNPQPDKARTVIPAGTCRYGQPLSRV